MTDEKKNQYRIEYKLNGVGDLDEDYFVYEEDVATPVTSCKSEEYANNLIQYLKSEDKHILKLKAEIEALKREYVYDMCVSCRESKESVRRRWNDGYKEWACIDCVPVSEDS